MLLFFMWIEGIVFYMDLVNRMMFVVCSLCVMV